MKDNFESRDNRAHLYMKKKLKNSNYFYGNLPFERFLLYKTFKLV